MTASTHSHRLQVGGFTLDTESISLDADESRVPHAVLRATVPIDNRRRDITTNGRGQFGARDVFAQDPESWWFNPHGVPGPANTVLVDGQWVTTWTAPSSALPHSRTSFQYVPVQGLYSYTAATRVVADVDLLTVTMYVELVREGGWFSEVARITVGDVPAGEWRHVEASFTAPARAEYIHVHVETRAATGYGIGDQLRQDGVQLYRASPVLTLDPRTSPPPRVNVTMRQAFGYGRPLADLSADYAGATLGDLSAVGDDSQLLFRAGFEDGLDGFVGSNPDSGNFPTHQSTLIQSTEQAHTGTHSVEVVAVNPPDIRMMFSPLVPAEPGMPFYVDLWCFWTGAGGVAGGAVVLELYNADGDYLGQANGGGVGGPPDVWLRSRFGIAVPDNQSIAAVRMVAFLGSNDLAARVWFDDVEFRRARVGLGSLTAEYGRPLNASGWRPSTTVRGRLYLASAVADHGAGTVALTAHTDDGRLTEAGLVSRTPLAPSGSTVRDCVNLVLGELLGTALPAGTTGSQVVETDALAWRPGETGWDYLGPIVGMAGLRLWCDLAGAWRLDDPEQATAPGRLVASELNVTDLTDEISRDSGGWGDGAVVTFEWDDTTTGQRRVAYDAAGVAGGRTITRTVPRPYPGAGLARGILRRAQALGRVLGLSGVADYSVRPYQPAQATTPDGQVHASVVSAVSWSQPDDVMTVRTRDLLGITEHSYLYTPPGVTYDDVPAGVSYDEYQWTG